MKLRIIACSAAAVCALLLWWTLSRNKTGNAPETAESISNRFATANRPESTGNEQPAPPAESPNVTKHFPESDRASSNGYEPRVLRAWQEPIEFYGKVVDEGGNPIPQVKIHFRWTESPSEDGEKTADSESDNEGLFSLRDKHGASLDVSCSKNGYYSSHHGHQVFNYALAQNIISPDQTHPVVFVLRRKGKIDALIQRTFPAGRGQIAQLHRDGTPVEINLLNGEKTSAGGGQLVLQSWRNSGNSNAKAFDWKLVVSAPGGGLIQTDEEFAFSAPNLGYQPSITIDMPATASNWQNQLKTKFYIRLPDGNYGRLDLYFSSLNGVFTLRTAVNPSGSQGLESPN